MQFFAELTELDLSMASSIWAKNFNCENQEFEDYIKQTFVRLNSLLLTVNKLNQIAFCNSFLGYPMGIGTWSPLYT